MLAIRGREDHETAPARRQNEWPGSGLAEQECDSVDAVVGARGTLVDAQGTVVNASQTGYKIEHGYEGADGTWRPVGCLQTHADQVGGDRLPGGLGGGQVQLLARALSPGRSAASTSLLHTRIVRCVNTQLWRRRGRPSS